MGRLKFNRRRIARIASGIGALALIGAVLIFLLQREVTASVFIMALIGVAGLTLWLTLLPDDLQALISGRQALYGGNSILITVLFAGVIMIAYGFANATNVSADLTSYRTYSLRPDVASLIQSLKKPLIITVFYTNAQLNQAAYEQPVLRLFSDASNGMIQIQTIDPEKQPVVARSFGVTSTVHAFITGVTANGQPDLTSGKIATLTNDYVGEQQIADAILLLEAVGKFKVLFATGDGEISTESGGTATDLRSGLESVGMNTSTIDLSTQDIPADTSALVLLAPKSDLNAAETDRINQYMGNGGRLMLMAQPNFFVNVTAPNPPLDFTFLQPTSPMTTYLWDNWGLRPQNDVVYDPGSYVDSPYNLLTAKAAIHPIMAKDQAGTAQLQALIYSARSWELATADQKPQNVTLTPLIGTSDKAFGAIDIAAVQRSPDAYQRSAKDLSGPLVMAVAGQNTKNNSRLVVIGDSQWAENKVDQQYGNALLWSNMMNWLTEYDQKTTVSPTVKPLPLITTTDTLNAIVVVTMVVLPGLVLIMGGLVWRDRAGR